jgi:signal transduction histidine kinase
MRRRFLTVASHELRTPVTGLLGYAQVELRRVKRHGALDPERVVTTLQAIERQARNLALLISRLLDVTMIDGGQVTLDQEEIDVAALVTKVVSRVRRQTSRHILLTDAPECLVGWLDPFWIEKVLLNLLDNAIRYSPEGGPIEVSLDPAEPGRMTLTVRDYGIGIPPDQLGRIFDRYVGAHEDSHRSGIGLGLSICRQIVEMHGGEIRAEAPETGGTRLRVTLPAHGPTRVSGGI